MSYNSRNNTRSTSTAHKKHSGCSNGVANDKVWFSAWNYSQRHGMTKIIAGPSKNTKVATAKNGLEYENWCVTVTPERAKPYQVTGFFNCRSGILTVRDLGWVLNPNAPNGGYCGQFGRKGK